MTNPLPLALYVHFPWCIKKCPYCDFNSHSLKTVLPESDYVKALLADLEHDLRHFQIDRQLTSVFLGGGTPSLFSPRAVADLLSGIGRRIELCPDVEITLEANPGTFEIEKFKAFRAAGVNRLSVGVQSFNDRHLAQLGRIHSAGEAVKAIDAALRSGFDNLNIDLMFGLPGEDICEALNGMRTAVDLCPAHISFYQLTLEPNTWFYKHPPKLPDDEDVALIQQACHEILENRGYRQYEISAYALENRRCRHNENYWRFGDYLGIGAGAHGKITRRLPNGLSRYWKVKHPDLFLKSAGTGRSLGEIRDVPTADLPLEFAMNRLRLKDGFEIADFSARTGLSPGALEPAMSRCLQRGLLEIHDNKVACSPTGWRFLDSVLQEFLAD
ncbi:MAG: radical SAM family heme chaperone HemW [Gammaproteobacteria bacterium]